MTEIDSRYDAWLEDSGPAALVLREHLVPVEGEDGVLFPATYAASEDGKFKGGYNIDELEDGHNVCLVDSVGSQANRIEPIFSKGAYASLVPQFVVNVGHKKINLLEAGHRAGDAIIRCSSLQKKLREAFQSVLAGDMEPLAKIAPTSLVFGVWDSRDTQAKLPRLVSSTIRAFDVRPLTRSAQYIPAVDYVAEDLLPEPANNQVRDTYAKRGFIHVPASASHGGVIARGGVRRDASLHLAALRLLTANEEKRTRQLRRYILGLALTALTHPPSGYLRQGCNLVLDPSKKREFMLVHCDGRREPCEISHANALEFAQVAARAFGPEKGEGVEFDKSLAELDLKGDEGKATKNGTKRSKKK